MAPQPGNPENRPNWFSYIVVFFLAVIPFVYSSKGIDPNLLPRQILLCSYIILSCVVLFFYERKNKTAFSLHSLFSFLFIGLAAWYWISIAQAGNVIEANYTAFKITTYCMTFLVTLFLMQAGVIGIKQLSAGFTIGLLFTAGLVLSDIMALKHSGIRLFEADHVYKINATFGHKNLLSAYVLFSLPFAIIQWRLNTSRLTRAGIILLTGIAFLLIIVLQTRAVLLALVVSVMAVSFVSVITGAYSKKYKSVPLLLVLGAVLFASGLYIFRGKFSVISRTESFKERAALWQNSWDMLKEYPMGVGPANWQIFLPKYGIQKFYDFNFRVSEGLTTFQRPHNDFLWVACETGVVGGIFFLALFVCLLAYLSRLIKNESKKNDRFIYQVLFGLITAYAVVSLVDFPLERMEHSFLFAISAAFICSKTTVQRINLPVNRWFLLILLLIPVIIINVCHKRWQSELYLKKMYRAHAQGNWQQLISSGIKANTAYMNMDYFSLPISWYIGVAYFTSGDIAIAKKYFLQAYETNPYQVHVLNNLGVCYEKEQDYEKALPLLEQAHQISPTFSDGISTLAGAYYNKQRYDDAWKVISRFKYDDSNWQFKLFATAIIKAKLEQMAAAEKDAGRKQRIAALGDNEALLMKAYKESQQLNREYFSYLLANE